MARSPIALPRGLTPLIAAAGAYLLAGRSQQPETFERERVLLFDVNGTLLQIEYLAPLFRRVFGESRMLREWFSQTVLTSQYLTLAGAYAEFGAIGSAVLQMLADANGVRLTGRDRAELKWRTQSMPPYREVPAALDRLRRAGFRLATLSNSAPKATAAQLHRAGLAEFFETSLSVDAVARYKPAPETYRYAARRLGARLAQLRLVAAHTWDVTGALEAGCAAALVTRSTAPLSLPGLPQPDITGPDLADVAAQIIRQDR